jgi:transcription initiation factor TFIIIB Brf1 subunit/transcription initiation factor TFIIB
MDLEVGGMSRMTDMDFMSLHNKITGKVNIEDFSENLKDMFTCENCGEDQLYKDSNGTNTCGNCGAVSNEIDSKHERRNDADGEDQTRCGMAIDKRLIEYSYSTGIQMSKNSKAYRDIQRIVIWNNIPPKERAMKDRFDNIEWKCSMCDIDKATIETVKDIYYDICEKMDKDSSYKKKRAANNEGLQAASLLHTYNLEGRPRTIKEVAKIFNIETKYVSNGYKILTSLLNVDDVESSNSYTDFIDRFCDKLELVDKVKDRVSEISIKAEKLGILDSNAPVSVVAGCIYFVITEMALTNVTKSHVANVCGVSPPTVNQVCDKLFRNTIKLIMS